MDERERARRQQVAETKRRQRQFEERAKAKAAAEEEAVRLSLSLSFSHARPRASLHGSPRFPHLDSPRNDSRAPSAPLPPRLQAKRVLRERKERRAAATAAIHKPDEPSPGSGRARILRKGTGTAGAFGRRGLPQRASPAERPAATAFGSRVRATRPRGWTDRGGDDEYLPIDPHRDHHLERALVTSPERSPEPPRVDHRDAANHLRRFLRERRAATRESDAVSDASSRRHRRTSDGSAPSPSAPWRLLKANAAANLGAILGELGGSEGARPENRVAPPGGVITSFSPTSAAAEHPDSHAETARWMRAHLPDGPASFADAEETKPSATSHSTTTKSTTTSEARAATVSSSIVSPATPGEDDDAVRTVRDSLEADDFSSGVGSHARVWRDGDDASDGEGEEEAEEDGSPQTLSAARAAMAARSATNTAGDAARPTNLFRDSLAEMPPAVTSATVAELVSSVNGVLDSMEEFRAIERGVDENLAGRRVADMRSGRFRVQADETGIISEYAAPVGSGPVAVTESVEVEERREETREETREERRVCSAAELISSLEPATSPRAPIAVVATPAPTEMVAAAATAPVAGGFSSSSASSNRVSAIPVATPVAVTREAARRLVRAGIPLPDKYREVLGPAPERRPPARPATEEEEVAALPDAPERSPSTASPNGVPRAPAPSSTSTPPSREFGYARTLDPSPPSATRRRSPASRAPDDREKMRKVAERELKLEGSYAAVAEEAAARRTREVRRLATLEAEARRAKAEESAVAARRAAQEARERQHHTVFAPPRSSSAGRRRGRREREFEPNPRRNYFDASAEREGGGWDEARWEEDDGFAPAPPPSVTPRAKAVTPHGRRGFNSARVRFAETPEGRAARELLGGGGGGRAPLGERFVNRMRADPGGAPTSLSTEEAKLLASLKRLDAHSLETGAASRSRSARDRDDAGRLADGLTDRPSFGSRRSLEEASLLASLARLDGALGAASPNGGLNGGFRGDGDGEYSRRGGGGPAPVGTPAPVFPTGVQPASRRLVSREPAPKTTRRWRPPNREEGPVRDEWGAPPPRPTPTRRGAIPPGRSAKKHRAVVGVVAAETSGGGSAARGSERGRRHVRDSGGRIEISTDFRGNARVDDYYAPRRGGGY